MNHDIEKLHRAADKVRTKWFKKQHKRLQERELLKREYEIRIHCLLVSITADPHYASVSFLGVKQPHIVVEITTNLAGCGTVKGLGIARCQARDKWDEKEGVDRATKKAVRDAARKLAGLDGWL